MKITKLLTKTTLILTALCLIFGFTAFADESTVRVTFDLESSYNWHIPSELMIDAGEVKAASGDYEKEFEISIDSLILKPTEQVQVSIKKEAGERYESSTKTFIMYDTYVYNDNPIEYYIRELGSENNIGINETILTATYNGFTGSPITKTIRLVLPITSTTLKRAGNYRSSLIFQAQIVDTNA